MAVSRILTFCFFFVMATAAAETVRLADGSIYTGPLRDGMLDGHGVLEWSNGNRYEGGFSDGLMDGRGIYDYASGDRYEGAMRAGFPHGLGHLEFAHGGNYQGEFRAGYPHGEGTMRYPDGTTYTGQMAHGVPSGSGTLRYQSGEVYEGEFADGVEHGDGTMTMSGMTYTGRFEEGSLVKGVWEDGHGARYVGGFKDWTFSGEGEFFTGYGDVYRGQFDNGDFVQGVSEKAAGDIEEGEFLGWTLHGKGKRIAEDGTVTEGTFEFGELSQTAIRDSVAEGLFSALKGALNAWFPRPDPDELVAERSLYVQSELLAQTLSQLEPQDPDQIDLYALHVGGDGGQEVFRREVEFARDLFGTELDGRVVSLTNSRTSVERLPMATRTSIRRSLDSIAQTMDPRQDILFVYLTSHGSPDHEFVLNQNGMDLPDLSAAELGGLLKAHPFAYKVIVVSACYSGGFIPFLLDGKTTVITAARADRTSFGCTDDNDFTDFGRALLDDNLSEADGLVQAFETARERIALAEEDQGIEQASEPQMHNEPAATAQFDAWLSQR